jgi:hypothetical protein
MHHINMTKNPQNDFTKSQQDSYLVVLVVTDPNKQPKREKINIRLGFSTPSVYLSLQSADVRSTQ